MCGEEDKLYKKEAEVKDINLLLVDKIEGKMEVEVKTRYSAKSAKAKISSLGDDRIKVVFDEPQRAITPRSISGVLHGRYCPRRGQIGPIRHFLRCQTSINTS